MAIENLFCKRSDLHISEASFGVGHDEMKKLMKKLTLEYGDIVVESLAHNENASLAHNENASFHLKVGKDKYINMHMVGRLHLFCYELKISLKSKTYEELYVLYKLTQEG